jgi:hypothetical protein
MYRLHTYAWVHGGSSGSGDVSSETMRLLMRGMAAGQVHDMAIRFIFSCEMGRGWGGVDGEKKWGGGGVGWGGVGWGGVGWGGVGWMGRRGLVQ